MAKIRQTIRAVLPTYLKDRQKWRKQILRNVRRVKEENGIEYEPRRQKADGRRQKAVSSEQ